MENCLKRNSIENVPWGGKIKYHWTNEGLLTRLVRITEPLGWKGSEKLYSLTLYPKLESLLLYFLTPDLLLSESPRGINKQIQISKTNSRWTALEYLCVYVRVCMCVHTHIHTCTHRGGSQREFMAINEFLATFSLRILILSGNAIIIVLYVYKSNTFHYKKVRNFLEV